MALTYFETVLADNPYLFWPLDEPPQPGGQIWNPQDYSGNGIYGLANYEMVAGAEGVVDDGGLSANLLGTFRSYALAITAFLDQPDASSYTVEAWVRTTDAGAGGRIVVGDYGSININSSGTLGTYDNKADFTVYTQYTTLGAFKFFTAQAGPINNGKDRHLVGVYDAGASTIALFVDGQRVATTAVDGLIAGWTTLRVGASASSSYHFTGNVDCVAFYQHALSDARIYQHWLVGRRKGLMNVERTSYIYSKMPNGEWLPMELLGSR